MTYDCPYCDRPIDPLAAGVLQKLEGWGDRVGTRASGKHGGSDVLYRRYLNEFAHKHCVKRERGGVSGKQGALL